MSKPDELYARLGFDPRDPEAGSVSFEDPYEIESAEDEESHPRRGMRQGAQKHFRSIAFVLAAMALLVFGLWAAGFIGTPSGPQSMIACGDSCAGAPPSVPSASAAPPIPSPLLNWERDAFDRNNEPVIDHFSGKARAPIVLPPLGMTVEVKGTTPAKPSLATWAFDYLRIPAGTLEIRHAGQAFTLSMFNHTVRADGLLVDASAMLTRYLVTLLIIFLAFPLYLLIDNHLRWSTDGLLPSSVVFRLSVIAALLMFVGLGNLPGLALYLIPIALFPQAVMRRLTYAAFGAGCCVAAATTSIEPPHAALSHLYGILGVYTVDIAGLGLLGLTCLIMTAVSVPKRSITVNVSSPMVQDVRVIETR